MVESADKILKCDRSMKFTEQYVPVVLFIVLYKVVLTFEYMDVILKFDMSILLSCGAVYSAVQDDSNF